MGPTSSRRALATDAAVTATSRNGIRISVVDRNPLFRAGIVHVLNVQPGMTVVAEGDSIDSLRHSESSDVLIVDSRLLAKSPDFMRSATERGSCWRVLLLASSPDKDQARAALAAGVRGYVLRSVSGLELAEAVRALHRGEGYVSPTLAASLLTHSAVGRASPASPSPLDQLTFREGEIFRLLAIGLKNGEIGQRLELTEKSVKCYITRIFDKLQVRNRVEAAMLANYGRPPADGGVGGNRTSLRANH
jgi:DNA-binding NarL/FixJ family response regulator